MKLTYNIEKEEWLEGYDLQWRLFRKKFTYIKAAIFAVPLLLFMQQLWIDPYYTMGWFCLAICIAAISAILATPKMERKSSERALEALKNDTYVLEIDGDKLSVLTVLPKDDSDLERDENGEVIPLPEIKPSVIDLKDKSVKAVEGEKIIGVFSNDFSAVIPKRPLSMYELGDLKSALKLN